MGSEGKHPESILRVMVLMLEDKVDFKIQACVYLFLVLQHPLEEAESEMLLFIPYRWVALLLRMRLAFQDASVRVRYRGRKSTSSSSYCQIPCDKARTLGLWTKSKNHWTAHEPAGFWRVSMSLGGHTQENSEAILATLGPHALQIRATE